MPCLNRCDLLISLGALAAGAATGGPASYCQGMMASTFSLPNTEGNGMPMTTMARLEMIVELAPKLRQRDISPVELTRSCLERIEKLNPSLNAFITVTAESALKDSIDTAGVRYK